MNKETRCNGALKLEYREDDNDMPRIAGHAAVFNSDSEPIYGMFVEQIAPGAFKRAIDERQDVRALVDHDTAKVLGRTKAGTLSLREDSVGLAVEINPPETTVARDVVGLLKRGDVNQMSFGFTVKEEEFIRGGASNGMDLRIVKDVDLFEVSVVTFPAYGDTSVAVRSHSDWRESITDGGDLDLRKRRLDLYCTR